MTPLRVQLEGTGYSEYAQERVNQIMEQRSISMELLTKDYECQGLVVQHFSRRNYHLGPG